jgi:hypothetical protein
MQKVVPFMTLKIHTLARMPSAFVWLLLGTVPIATLNGAVLFSDNFESAVSVSPYTIAQQQANNSLATDSDPGLAQVGSWFTYAGEADGGPSLFGVQVTSKVDPPYTGTYQGSNVLRIFRSPTGSGSAVAANFATTQYGGKVRATWMQMLHPASAYNCMIHFSGTASPGGEGFDTARLSLVIHSDGSCVYYAGGWVPINGLTATMNKWQNHQLDVDLDSQKWTWTIDGVSSGEVSGFGNAPGNTAASITFRGGGSANDLFYIDSLNVTQVPTAIAWTRNGNQLTMSWQNSGFVLQENDNLSNATGWIDVVNGGTSPVTVTMSGTRKFYRLAPHIIITDCDSLQAAINARMSQGGGYVTVPAGMTISCGSYLNPIEPTLQTKQSLLVREGVTLDLNGGTIEINPTDTGHGVRLSSHSGIKNGTVRVVNYINQSSQSIFNSGISVGAAYSEGGTVQNPSYFSSITDWRIENITVDQPFPRSAIQVMSESSHGVISNVTILDSTNAAIGIGFDWGSVGPITTADDQIQHMRDLFDQGMIYSTHPHDILIDGVHIGNLGNNDTDDQAGIRTAACYNFTIRNVTVAGARTGIALRPGDLGFEFALNPDRPFAHANYSLSNFTFSNIRGKGLILDGLSDNIWRAGLSYGYVPLIDPTYPGLKGAVIKDGTLRGTGAVENYGIYSFANSSCVISNLDIQGFETGVRLHAWINGTTLTSNVVAHSRSWGVRVGISGPEPGVTQVKNVLINQSQIFRNGEGDGQTGGIVLAMTDGVTVTNNTIGALAAETQRYGIFVSNLATNVTVLPNTFGAVAPGGAPLFFQP